MSLIEYSKRPSDRKEAAFHECQNQNLGISYERTDLYGSISPDQTAQTSEESPSPYTAGIYTTSLMLGGNPVEIAITVDQDYISSIRFRQLSESVAAMYPLMEPALDALSAQICETQSLENLSYSEDSQYTSLMLVSAIKTALAKAEKAAP